MVRERYLKDGLPIRLGGLAANLGRIQSFVALGASDAVIESLMDESKHFIEWTAAEAAIDTAAELVQLQVELASWHLRWRRMRHAVLREQISTRAAAWSERVLEMSGLLG